MPRHRKRHGAAQEGIRVAQYLEYAGYVANRTRDRARALLVSTSRSRGGLAVSSEQRRFRADWVISSTARWKAASFVREGRAKPLSLRTNWSAEARISSSVAGGSKLNSVRMLRHMGLPHFHSRMSHSRMSHSRMPHSRRCVAARRAIRSHERLDAGLRAAEHQC